MEWLIKEWNTSTGAYKRTLGYLKSVNYKAQCNETSDLRFGCLLNEVLTVEVYDSTEAKLTQGAWVSFEANNNPAATDASRTAGYTDSNYTFYGIYKVDQVIDGKGFYTFVAYSVTHDLNVDYSARLKELGNSGSFPMTIQDLIDDACSYIGLSFSRFGTTSPLNIAQINKFYANGITVRDILTFGAALEGSYVADVMGNNDARDYSSFPPTSPISTQRGVYFKSYRQRANFNSTNQSADYYLVAPTDGAVDHSAFTNPLFGWFANVYYKENGLEAASSINNIDRVESYRSDGSLSDYFSLGGSNNIYKITNNILLDSSVSGVPLTRLYVAAASAIGSPVLRPSTVRLFPFNCPFRCGDIANVTNGDGVSFQMPIMQFEINDDEAVLESSGNEFYESAQNQYTTPEEVGTSNSVEIENLRESKADLSMLGGAYLVTEAIAANGSVSKTVANSSRFLIVTSGPAAATKGMWIANANSSGTVSISAVLSASNITISPDTNSISIASTAVCTALIIVFNGSVS